MAKVDNDATIKQVLNEIVERWPRWGFWRCFNWLRAKDYRWNHIRVWRVYCSMKLNLLKRKKRMLLKRMYQPLVVKPLANESWSIDIMHDTLYSGKRFHILNVLDEGVGECLNIKIIYI